jgi:uncharacterized membrane protein
MGDRPKLKIPWSPLEKGLEVASLLGLAFLLWITFSAWAGLPDKVPVHFGFTGQPDRWGDRNTLVLLPVVALFVGALITLFEGLPNLYNYPVKVTEENSERLYGLGRSLLIWVKALIIWTFAYIQWTMIQVAKGLTSGLAWYYLPALVGIILAVSIWHVVAMYRAR